MNEGTLARRIAAARDGRAELVLKNARVVNVFTNEIIPCDVAVYDGVIVGLGGYSCENEYDCGGAYLCPGFIDSHMHIESSMCCPSEFARLVLPFGTTSVVADPHEIANVCGMDGVRFMKRDAEAGFSVYCMFPSCVPCVEFEENFAPLTNEDAAALLYEGVVHGLGEVMDWDAVIDGREDMLKKLEMFSERPIDGHAPGVSGRRLAAYIMGGAATDHEAYAFEEVLEKLRAGMRVLIRVGSAANDMEQVLRLLAKRKIPLEQVLLCTDDKHTGDILREGHVNHIARLAVRSGIPAVEAVKMATINAARAYGLKGKGAVAPGYDADLVLFSDLEAFEPMDVFVQGKNVRSLAWTRTPVPERLLRTVNPAPLLEGAFALCVNGKMPVIEMMAGQLATKLFYEEVPQRDGQFTPDGEYLKIACIERHHATGHVGLGIVKNFGLVSGAVASTVAHDSHNIVALGTNDADMRIAVEALVNMGGGYVFVENGRIVAEISLPVGGLMTDAPYEALVEKQERFLSALYARGVKKDDGDPLLRLSFFSLPVIPEARITTLGLYDVIDRRFL